MNLIIMNLYFIFNQKLSLVYKNKKDLWIYLIFFTLNKKDEHYRNLELSNLYELGVDEKEVIKNKALSQEKWSNYEYMEDWIGV